MKSNERDMLVELKTEFARINESLLSIRTDLKEVITSQHSNSTDIQLIKKDIDNLYKISKCNKTDADKNEERINKIESKQSWILAKVGAITTIITGVITWLIK